MSNHHQFKPTTPRTAETMRELFASNAFACVQMSFGVIFKTKYVYNVQYFSNNINATRQTRLISIRICVFGLCSVRHIVRSCQQFGLEAASWPFAVHFYFTIIIMMRMLGQTERIWYFNNICHASTLHRPIRVVSNPASECVKYFRHLKYCAS